MTDADDDTPPAPLAPDGGPWHNFYGRRHGKQLRARQRHLLEIWLPDLTPPGIERADNPQRRPLDLDRLFPGKSDFWLEVGFGGGEHLLAQARRHPEIGLIGCEPFVNGMAMLLSAMADRPVDNLRLYQGDARLLFEVLPAASLGQVFVLYPDPWPKKRHVGRRFIGEENLDWLARLMKPGGVLRLASDIPAYIAHSREAVMRHPYFEITADTPEPWADWVSTRYEAKALREGRTPRYVTIRRC